MLPYGIDFASPRCRRVRYVHGVLTAQRVQQRRCRAGSRRQKASLSAGGVALHRDSSQRTRVANMWWVTRHPVEPWQARRARRCRAGRWLCTHV